MSPCAFGHVSSYAWVGCIKLPALVCAACVLWCTCFVWHGTCSLPIAMGVVMAVAVAMAMDCGAITN